jgi:uncharacterized cupredoxin-like copper-binding protein
MVQGRRSGLWLARLIVASALVIAASACGGDDSAETATDVGSGTRTSTTDTGDAAAGADVETYCAETLEIETLPAPEVDFESMSEEELAAFAKQFARDELQPRAAAVRAATPPEIEEDVDVLVDAVDRVAETGDFGVFEEPEVDAASARVHQFDVASCGWNVVDVAASDYAFAGIDAEVDAGATTFELTNEGDEFHELVILRKKRGVTESFDEILQLPEEEGRTRVDAVAATDPVEPGAGDTYVVADLTAGEYVAVCFIPVGSTMEAHDAGQEADGPPHMTRGMKTEFTVG